MSVTDLPADPLDALLELARREATLGRKRREAIAAARASGATWAQVGDALGVTRQAAWEYFSRSTRVRLDQSAAAGAELLTTRPWRWRSTR